jgi:hypothetical protein
MLKTKHRFHLSTTRQHPLVVALALHVGVEIPKERLVIIQEALREVVVEGLLSEGSAHEVEVKDGDGEIGKR